MGFFTAAGASSVGVVGVQRAADQAGVVPRRRHSPTGNPLHPKLPGSFPLVAASVPNHDAFSPAWNPTQLLTNGALPLERRGPRPGSRIYGPPAQPHVTVRLSVSIDFETSAKNVTQCVWVLTVWQLQHYEQPSLIAHLANGPAPNDSGISDCHCETQLTCMISVLTHSRMPNSISPSPTMATRPWAGASPSSIQPPR